MDRHLYLVRLPVTPRGERGNLTAHWSAATVSVIAGSPTQAAQAAGLAVAKRGWDEDLRSARVDLIGQVIEADGVEHDGVLAVDIR
jgi:hypothetical protein